MSLYFKYFAIQLKSQMQYKLSFFLTLVAQFLISFTEVAGIYFMFSSLSIVENYTLEEIFLCYSAVLMAFSIAQTFMRGFDMFPRMLGNGQFDRILVRPLNVIFQVTASQMDFGRLGRLLQAAIILGIAIPNSGVIWTWDKIVTYVLMIICGCLVFSGLFIIYAAFSFFTTEGLEFMNILTDGGAILGKYPFSVYGKGILHFLTFIVPLALFQYYPLQYLLDRQDSIFYMIAPTLSLLFLIPSCIFYRFGLKRYSSSGS